MTPSTWPPPPPGDSTLLNLLSQKTKTPGKTGQKTLLHLHCLFKIIFATTASSVGYVYSSLLFTRPTPSRQSNTVYSQMVLEQSPRGRMQPRGQTVLPWNKLSPPPGLKLTFVPVYFVRCCHFLNNLLYLFYDRSA